MTQKKTIKTKDSVGSSIHTITLHKQVPDLPQNTYQRGKWVEWGTGNIFPYELINLTSQSSVTKSLINMISTYILGNGVIKKRNKTIPDPNPDETWDELIEKVTVDYVTFGGFAIQIVPNKGGKSVSIYHEDISTIRVVEFDEFDVVTKYGKHYDWPNISGRSQPVYLDAFKNMEELKGPSLYMYIDYVPTNKFYPIPSYYQGITYVHADAEIQKYHNQIIAHGFTPSAFINFPNNPSEDQKEEIITAIRSKFQGAANAGDVMVMFGLDADELPVITPFKQDLDSEIFQGITDIIFQKIITAFNLSSPTLAGIATPGKLGAVNELIESYILFNETVIKQKRKKILKTLGWLKGIDLEIEDFDLQEKLKKQDEPTNNI